MGVTMLTEKMVLVVDDEPAIREFATKALSAAGFLTSVAGDGDEAIRSLEVVPFDLAVVDILMPEKEGVETIIEIKRRWPDCKIIAMAGEGRVSAADYLRLATYFGADATMTKPLTNAAVVEAVRGMLAKPAQVH
ncbi:MAG: response regulator [Caulobacteraceae bacterium]